MGIVRGRFIASGFIASGFIAFLLKTLSTRDRDSPLYFKIVEFILTAYSKRNVYRVTILCFSFLGIFQSRFFCCDLYKLIRDD